jgi:hypothetical protein
MDMYLLESALMLLKKHGVTSYSCPEFSVTFSPNYPSFEAPYPTTPFDDEPTAPAVDPLQEAARMMRQRQDDLAKAYGMESEVTSV